MIVIGSRRKKKTNQIGRNNMEGFWFGFKAVWAVFNGKVIGMAVGIFSFVIAVVVAILAVVWGWELLVHR